MELNNIIASLLRTRYLLTARITVRKSDKNAVDMVLCPGDRLSCCTCTTNHYNGEEKESRTVVTVVPSRCPCYCGTICCQESPDAIRGTRPTFRSGSEDFSGVALTAVVVHDVPLIARLRRLQVRADA